MPREGPHALGHLLSSRAHEVRHVHPQHIEYVYLRLLCVQDGTHIDVCACMHTLTNLTLVCIS